MSTTPTSSPLNRRAFLGRFAAGVGVSAVLAACGGGDTPDGAATGGAAEVVDASTCIGHAVLTEQELALRNNLGYVDASPKPEANCANCRFLQALENSPCGGCQLFAGPVSPGGYCNSWAAVAV